MALSEVSEPSVATMILFILAVGILARPPHTLCSLHIYAECKIFGNRAYPPIIHQSIDSKIIPRVLLNNQLQNMILLKRLLQETLCDKIPIKKLLYGLPVKTEDGQYPCTTSQRTIYGESYRVDTL